MLIIDTRERVIIERLMTEPYNYVPDIDFRIVELQAGDIAISHNGYLVCGIERKTASDFISTWFSKNNRAGGSGAAQSDRLSGQLFDTYMSYIYSGIIIEIGDAYSNPHLRLKMDKVEKRLRTLGWYLNPIQFSDVTETIEYVIDLDKKFCSGWVPMATKKVAVRDHSKSDITAVLSVLSIGIGEQKGELITQRYKTLSKFIEVIRLNPDDLLNINGIGKKLVKNILEKLVG